jgi:hypothetical protein
MKQLRGGVRQQRITYITTPKNFRAAIRAEVYQELLSTF